MATVQALTEMEKQFWQAMVDHDDDIAASMLAEPALMVNSHGSMKFDRAGYRPGSVTGASGCA